MSEHYELTYIVSIKHLDDELKKVTDLVTGFIKGFGGVVTAEQSLGKLRLAYPIKQTHQGTYIVNEINLDPEMVIKLDKQLTLENSILRHLIIKKKIRTEAEIKREKEIQDRLIKETEQEIDKLEKSSKKFVKKEEVSEKVETPVTEVKKTVRSKDTSMEDLDKKLDEILTDDLL